MNKEVVHKHLLAAIESKIIQTQEVLNDATISIHNETKSSAGDKHETGRAMAQLEQEKLGKQLQLIKNLRDAASRISFSEINSQIGFGSLVKWNNQWFYFSVGLGTIQVENTTVFCLSITSPLGEQMRNKKVGDLVAINEQSSKIEIVK